jgi:tetratricopeptide (TPR) repeat protein
MTDAQFAYDVFISRRGSAADIAREVVKVLEAEGLRVIEQSHDFPAGGTFPLDIDKGLTEARHFLILYSHDYHESYWTKLEMAAAHAAVADSNGDRRIGVLWCDAAQPEGLLHGATAGSLFGVSDPAERERIILDVALGRTPASRRSPRVLGGTMPFRNPLFTGRDTVLAELHTALGSGTPNQTVVHGLGGMGKTTLAREYVGRYEADYPGGVWWITAADRAGMQAGLADLARALNPRLPIDTPEPDAAAAALDALRARTEPFLLVCDNAPDPASLTGLLPQRGPRVLITSRHADWATQASELSLRSPPEDEAVALLQARAGRPGQDPEGALRLAQELGCLPLALEVAGAYARSTGSRFDAIAAQVEPLLRRASRNPDYPASVAAAFELSIARLGPLALAILCRLAWYAPDRIPCSLFQDLAEEVLCNDALEELTLASLVALDPLEPTGPTVSVHRLVQAVVRHRLAGQGTEAAARDQAVARLAAAFPYAFNEPTHWPLCRVLLPHVRSVAHRVGQGAETADLAHLLDLTGSFLHGSGDATAAFPLYRRALDSCERVLGPEHPNTLASVNSLACCLQTLGDAAAALPLYRRALDSNERVLGPEHPNTLASVNNLAGCLRALGDAAAALPLYRRALDRSERVLGPEHPQTQGSVNNLASCLRALGDAAAALPLHRRALDSRERVLGPEHPDTLISVSNLALCLETLGDAAAALPLYRRALAGAERVLGPDHTTTRTIRANLDRVTPRP